MTAVPVLSDHAYQARRITLTLPDNGGRHTLNVGSWNLLNQCRAQSKHLLLPNNPYGITETHKEYEERKEKEIEELIARGDDLIFLQEVDLFIRKGQEERLQKLRDNGYDYLLTKKESESGHHQQPLVILYKRDKLATDNKALASALLSAAEPGKEPTYRGAKAIFCLRGTNVTITATNLHLHYGRDYIKEMREKLGDHQTDLHIMAGDTNSITLRDLNSPRSTRATNFSLSKTTGKLTTLHDDTQEKTYDEVFIHSRHPVTITHAPHNQYVTINKKGEAEFHTTGEPVAPVVRKQTTMPAVPTPGFFNNIAPKRPSAHKQPVNNTKTYYSYYVLNNKSGRRHPSQLEAKSSRYPTYRGDALKSHILDKLLPQLRRCKSLAALESARKKIIKSKDYRILKGGQRLFTWLAHGLIKTDSVRAFEQAYNEKKRQLSQSSRNPKSRLVVGPTGYTRSY